MFYDRFLELCEAQGVKPKKAVTDMNLSNSIATAWKNRGLTPKSETLSKIAQHFEVSMDFFLERPPFDNWPLINQDRNHFIEYVDADYDATDLVWGINKTNVDKASLINFIQFLGDVVEYAQPTEAGGWLVSVRPLYRKKEKVSAQENERNLDQQLSGIDFALSGEIHGLTDNEKQDILDYIRFKKSQRGGGDK